MELEDKAKVVASVVGRICSISCRSSCFALDYLKEKVEFNLFFHIDRCKRAIAWQGIEQILPPKQPLHCLVIPSFFCGQGASFELNSDDITLDFQIKTSGFSKICRKILKYC